ncbi:MAG: 4Fe-4S binding protein [Bacteroidales bacterium]|jgi:polyferredoxin|nr:4Fe-4S binding protein [Bacteroidales bacterium]
MQRYLKPTRAVISILMLLAIGFTFLDFSDSLPVAWYNRILFLQLVPSAIKFMQTAAHGMAISAYGFIVILVLTLLFGRVYCSYVCPLGIFQDIITWFSGKTNRGVKKKCFRFATAQNRLRYTVLAVVILSLFTGSIALLNVMEPYSNFGRFTSGIFRPVYVAGNNLLVKIFESMGSYALYPVTIARANPFTLIIPLVMLALVVWLSFSRGRLYCNTVCPVGAFLGLVSKASLFKVKIEQPKCNRCGSCMFACKAQCIDVKNQSVDFSRCVGCGNCMKVCDKNSIGYALCTSKKNNLTAETRTDSSRRRFIASSMLLISALSSFSVKSLAQSRSRIEAPGDKTPAPGSGIGTGNEAVDKLYHVTPPGSISHDNFLNACTACHLCVSACPTDVLKPSFLEYGLFGIMQPFMDYRVSFCNFECVKCSEVCPSGAILPLTVEQKITTQTGKVRFVENNCIVYTDKTSCGSCSEHCPTQAVTMAPYIGELTIPKINTDICVGCGACEYACPVTPYKAIIVDGNPVHAIAQKPVQEELKEKPLEDFPF